MKSRMNDFREMNNVWSHSLNREERTLYCVWAQDRGCKTTEGVKGLMTAQERTREKALSPILPLSQHPSTSWAWIYLHSALLSSHPLASFLHGSHAPWGVTRCTFLSSAQTLHRWPQHPTSSPHLAWLPCPATLPPLSSPSWPCTSWQTAGFPVKHPSGPPLCQLSPTRSHSHLDVLNHRMTTI